MKPIPLEAELIGFRTNCFGYLAFAVVLLLATRLPAEENLIPDFTADGVFSVKIFGAKNIIPTSEVGGKFSFHYFNGNWEIQIDSQTGRGNGIDSAQLEKTILNCKKVDGGIRYYVTKKADQSTAEKKALPQAFAEAIPFPPPDDKGLFLCWLSLCPSAELPMIDSTHGRRFLSVNLLKEKENVGEYTKSYLAPENIFLSKLSIVNNGIEFVSENETLRLAPPFERGYREFQFQVLVITQFQRHAFPAKTTLQEFGPSANPKNRDDTYPTMTATLDVLRVERGFDVSSIAEPSKTVVAVDRRPERLPVGAAIKYMITDDQWVSPTDNKLAALVSLTQEHTARSRAAGPNRRLVILASLICFALISPLIWLKYGRR